jgi:electron transfer flavoprotein alpha subunit
MAEEKKIKRPRGIAQLLEGKCIACGARCQSSCNKDAIEMNDAGEPIIDAVKCIGCQKCVKICPSEALVMYFTPEEKAILEEIARQKAAAGVPATAEPELTEEEAALKAKLAQYKGVWVFVDHTGGEAADVSWELLGVGADLAKRVNSELCAMVIGDNVEHLCAEAFAYGAAKVYLIDDPVFHYYRTEPYYRAVSYLADRHKPEIILYGATGQGRDLGSAVATSLATGLTADCTGLDIDERGFLLQTRPAFGGNIMATIMTEVTRPQMSTVRPHVMPMPERVAGRSGEIIRESLPVQESDFLVKVLELVRESGHGVDVSAAEIIISGGRGMCASENFTLLQELADELDGVVGCSRSVVEAGWLPVEQQVGQTGKTVRPKIYFACGISGAIQHLVGMQDSDVIIAINKDKTAPIFEVATYGIVEDTLTVIPAITRRIRELKTAGAAKGKE